MDFIIQKVNGEDLSNATHDETLRAFNTAEQPIIVEVLRRATSKTSQETSANTKSQSIGTQTEPTLGCCCHKTFSLPGPPPIYSCVGDYENVLDATSDLESSDFERSYQMEYEEIRLYKTSNQDKIGLTLCYGPADEFGVTEIYIGDIEENSLAGQDGRIQQGDQIVKINDCEVKNRQEAIQCFSENKSEICLVIRRPTTECFQIEDELIDEEESFTRSLSGQEVSTMPLIVEEVTDCEENSTITDTATLPSQKEKDGKDSGVGQDSAQCSEQECESSHYESICLVDEPNLEEIFGTQCTNFRQILESKYMNINNESMEELCEQLNNFCQTGDFHRSVPKMGTRLISHGEKSLPRSESQDTAYNSAESCKSITSTLELNKTLSGSTLSLTESKKKSPKSEQSREKRRSRRNSDKQRVNHDQVSNSHIAYTTEDKLAETMAAQQKVLLEQSKSTTTLQSHSNNNQVSGNTSDVSSNMEWVVKRRADGSRYITRRPIRSKVLSERKKRLEDERCGMTTDDDAMSELKTGRHWSKEERRRHFQKAKEYQQRKLIMQQKIESLKKAAQQGQNNLIELSQKKMQKKTLRDFDFITVPELLAHRGQFSMASCNLLSVTTV